MKTNIIYNKDCLKGMKKLSDNSIDLVATDPPYGIKFMNKAWDKAIPSVDIWRECLRIMKPGSFAFVMCIPRQDCLSRMIISLEDAGFNVNFSSLYHCFASGFPKASNIGKMVDRKGRTILFFDEIRQMLQKYLKDSDLTIKQINERLGFATNGSGMAGHWFANITQQTLPTKKQYFQLKKLLKIPTNQFDKVYREIEEDKRPIIGSASNWGQATESLGIGGKSWNITLPYSDAAKALNGSYGGFQMKPAVEVILVAMKPIETKTYVDQALKNRKGITWQDDCMIPYKSDGDKDSTKWGNDTKVQHSEQKYGFKPLGKNLIGSNQGRFPANLICQDNILDDGKVRKSTGGSGLLSKNNKGGGHTIPGQSQGTGSFGDSGSFSRYFSLDSWFNKKLAELPESVRKTFPFLIVPKASKSEKNKGCEGLEAQTNQEYDGRTGQNNSDSRPDGSERKAVMMKNNHPTCKPVKLFSWLIVLGSREGDIVLDPFIGSGTTAVSAKMLKRKYIGYELDPEYLKIANCRINAVENTLF